MLDADQRQTLAETRIGEWLAGESRLGRPRDSAGVGLFLVIGGFLTRRRRMAIVAADRCSAGRRERLQGSPRSPLAPKRRRSIEVPKRRARLWRVAGPACRGYGAVHPGIRSESVYRSPCGAGKDRSSRHSRIAAIPGRGHALRIMRRANHREGPLCPRCGRLLISG